MYKYVYMYILYSITVVLLTCPLHVKLVTNFYLYFCFIFFLSFTMTMTSLMKNLT